MGLLRAQPCRVPVWSVKSTSRSKPVEAEKAWSLPGHSWLGQLCVSSITCNLHLELRCEREQTEQRIVYQMNVFIHMIEVEHQSCVHICVCSPASPDDFWNRRVEVEFGDEAVCDAKESLGVLLSLLLKLSHCVHISDRIHCRDRNSSTKSHINVCSLSLWRTGFNTCCSCQWQFDVLYQKQLRTSLWYTFYLFVEIQMRAQYPP